jgi:diguanylate cyclase (GGDEF)-like protein
MESISIEYPDKAGIKPVSIVMLDMDNLKKINDTFGHELGYGIKNLSEKLGYD